MIKKSIASILVVLIFINSLGCMSYKQIGIDDKNEIEKAKEIRLTTVDNKEYHLRNVKIEGSKISGNQWVENKIMERRIEFSLNQISKIEEVENLTPSAIWLVVGIAAGALIVFIANYSPNPYN